MERGTPRAGRDPGDAKKKKKPFESRMGCGRMSVEERAYVYLMGSSP